MAIATFNDSLRPRCGMVTHRRTGPTSSLQSSGSPAASLPITERDAPGQVAVGVGDDRAPGGVMTRRADQLDSGAGDVVDRRLDDRHVEHGTRRRAHDLRVERVDAARREHDGVGSGGFGGTHDRAQVARIAQAIEDDDEAGRGEGGGHVTLGDADDGEWVLRRLGAADALQHAGGQLVDRAGAVDRWRHDVVGLGGDELLDARPSGGDRFADQHRALDDEQTRLVTRTAAPQEAPQLLNSRIAERQGVHRRHIRPGHRCDVGTIRRGRLSPSRRACRTQRHRSPRDRRGSCGRPRRRRR